MVGSLGVRARLLVRRLLRALAAARLRRRCERSSNERTSEHETHDARVTHSNQDFTVPPSSPVRERTQDRSVRALAGGGTRTGISLARR